MRNKTTRILQKISVNRLCVLTILFLFTSLTGCFRHCYRAVPYKLCHTNLHQNVQEAFTTHAVSGDPFYYQEWWHFFQDPQLNYFIDQSLACHPDIKAADARIRQACYEAGIARSELFPHLFLVGSTAPQKVSEIAPGFFPGAKSTFVEGTLELRASYELDLWKKNRSLFYAALDRMQARIADYQEAKLLLSTTIAAFYFDLQMTLARIDLNKERLKAKEELFYLHQQQFNLGIASEFRLYQVQTEVQLIKDLIFRLEGEAARDRHALAALVGNLCCPGEGKADLVVRPSAIFTTPFPLPATLPIDLLARRPDITARKWLVEAACYDIKAAQADFFPRIDLMGVLGFRSIDLGQLFTGKTLVAMGQAMGVLPLYLGGKLRARLGYSRESLELAIEEYNQTVLNAVEETSNALSDLVYADSRKKSIEVAIKDARLLLDLTRQKFENAVYNKLTVLNAMENLFVQQDLELEIELARFEAAVGLMKAIGGGYYENPCG